MPVVLAGTRERGPPGAGPGDRPGQRPGDRSWRPDARGGGPVLRAPGQHRERSTRGRPGSRSATRASSRRTRPGGIRRRVGRNGSGAAIELGDWAGGVLGAIGLDLRPVAGPLEVRPMFDDVIRLASRREHFIRRLATTTVKERPPTGFTRTAVIHLKGRTDERLDIKHGGITLITSLARVYAVMGGLSENRTIRRLAARERARTHRGRHHARPGRSVPPPLADEARAPGPSGPRGFARRTTWSILARSVRSAGRV